MFRVPPAPVPQASIGVLHRLHDLGVLAHPQIVVRAPDGDLPVPTGPWFLARGNCRICVRVPRRCDNCPLPSGHRAVRGQCVEIHGFPPVIFSVISCGAFGSGSIQRHRRASGSGRTISQCSRSASAVNAVTSAKPAVSAGVSCGPERLDSQHHNRQRQPGDHRDRGTTSFIRAMPEMAGQMRQRGRAGIRC
jgi:hypothetical protein